MDEDQIESVEFESPYPRPLLRVADAGFCWPKSVMRRNGFTLLGVVIVIVGFIALEFVMCCVLVLVPIIWWLFRLYWPRRVPDEIYGPMWEQQNLFSSIAKSLGLGTRHLQKISTGLESTYTTPILDDHRIVFAAGLVDQLTTEECAALAVYACASHRTPVMPIYLCTLGLIALLFIDAFLPPMMFTLAFPASICIGYMVTTALIFWLVHVRAVSVVRRAGLEPALQSAFEFRRQLVRQIPWYARSPADTLRRFGIKFI